MLQRQARLNALLTTSRREAQLVAIRGTASYQPHINFGNINFGKVKMKIGAECALITNIPNRQFTFGPNPDTHLVWEYQLLWDTK